MEAPRTLQLTGVIREWNDARGFGFIERDSGGGRLFFHVRDVDTGAGRPEIGDRVSFAQGSGRDGRPAAIAVQYLDRQPVRGKAPLRVTIRIVGALTLATALLMLVFVAGGSNWLLMGYAVAGGVSYLAYWLDKRAAEGGRWRTSEATLHAIDLGFGIIGGLLAQAILRHKSSKTSFAVISALIYALHMAGLLALTFGLETLPA